MDWIQTNAVQLLGLLGTLALLGVTAWYAKTTRDMARANQRMADVAAQAAEDSARATAAAERSADAAREAAAIAQSQIAPKFTATIVTLAGGEGPTALLQVTSEGDPVVVQSARVRVATRASYDPPEIPDGVLTDARLEPFGVDSSLPRRLHHGEHLRFSHPEIRRGDRNPFNRMAVEIRYTFIEDGTHGGTREADFIGPPQIY